MKIQVLGCAGTVSQVTKTSAFLINDTVLMDGGTVCSSLSPAELARIESVFISHPHFDHIKGLPSLAETLVFMGNGSTVTINASETAIDAIRSHLLNDVIWPDFTRLPTPENPVIRYRPIRDGEPVSAGGVTITPHCLQERQADFGYLVDNGATSLLYTSDIGAGARLCLGGQVAEQVIVEVSFPDEKRDLATLTGHLTPSLLQELLAPLPTQPRTVFVSHMKTYYREQIVSQLQKLPLGNLVILSDGDVIRL